MPQYVKTVWVNGTVPALNDSNLNKMEQGIFDAFRQDGSTTMSGQLVTTAGSAATPAIAPTGDSNTGIFFPAADTIAFSKNGAEYLRFSGNLEEFYSTTTGAGTVAETQFRMDVGGGNANSKVAKIQALAYSPANQNSLAFFVGDWNNNNNIGTEKMRITSAGNVGIGTTSIPSVFGTTVKVAGSTGATIETSATNVNLRQFVSDSLAIGVIGTSSNHPFALYTNDQNRLHITSGGNVGIGTTNPTTILQVDDTYGGYRAGIVIKNTADGATGRGTGIEWHSGTGTTKGEIALTAIDASQNGYDMKFQTTATGGSKTTKMTITGAGHVGIGTTPSNWGSGYTAFSIKNAGNNISSSGASQLLLSSNAYDSGAGAWKYTDNGYFANLMEIGSNGYLFYTTQSTQGAGNPITWSERMRITSTGNVGIGTTSPNNYAGRSSVAINGTDGGILELMLGGTQKFQLYPLSSGNPNDIILNASATNGTLSFQSNGTNGMVLNQNRYVLIGYNSSNGAYPLQVNGQIFATSSTIATSDGRYKKDVVALDGALDIVKALNPVQFSWKDHPVHKFNTDVPTVGFIAQEVEQALVDKSYLTSIIKKSECTWETETGEFVKREVTRDVEKQVTREVEREITETIDGEEITRTVTEEVTETVIEQVTEIVQEPVKETHTEEFLGIAESNLIAILTKAVKELTAKVEALEAQLNGN